MPENKKLIEISLPLDAINKASSYEKMPGIGPHPRGIHLWWARRPLAAARAVLWSSLVDDPSAHPENFPTGEAQAKERERLHRLLSELVKWENTANEELLDEARAEIKKSMGAETLVFLDPFAGGGSIPLEAQRLGLEAHARDLNPVAVIINKAEIEIPPKFAGLPPVNPEGRKDLRGTAWPGASGLAEDVRYYGQWMKEEACKRIGHLYPKAELPDGKEATVIAWIWARTVKCPNPACGCEMPLASSFVLSKKEGKEAWIEPVIDHSNNTVDFIVKTGEGAPPPSPKAARGAKFKCVKCGADASPDYIKEEGMNSRMGTKLMAVVAEGQNGRIYVSPDAAQINAANIPKPDIFPIGHLADDPRNIWCLNYGLDTFDKLFTPRQLTALTTFSELVGEAQAKAEADAIAAGMKDDGIGLAADGKGAKAYGEAVGVYLAFVVDRIADFSTSVSRWSISNEKAMNLFSKQAVPMTWDFPEVNILGDGVGSLNAICKFLSNCILQLPSSNCYKSEASLAEAQKDYKLSNVIISTDPPYYDNIGYADLSDFFYIWLRESLKKTYPDLFKTMLVPKAEELVATPYRFGNDKKKAKNFFENGLFEAFRQMRKAARADAPVTIYYAFKQKEADDKKDDKTASTGWETMLTALIEAGFAITGTWPIRTEQSYRAISMNTNALASSIVLVCRKRPDDAPGTTRRAFLTELKNDLPPAIRQLQASNIAPVDMAQAAIGPGMAIFSKYSRVLEADGAPMGVRAALQAINAELDSYLAGQDGMLDEASRFCVELYSQAAFNDIRFGEADVLARAKNTSVEGLEALGLLHADKGLVRLSTRDELPKKPKEPIKLNLCLWLLTQYLARAMDQGGIEACAELAGQPNADEARNLAYRLFSIAERKKWNREAFVYNSLVMEWPRVKERAAQLKRTLQAGQGSLI